MLFDSLLLCAGVVCHAPQVQKLATESRLELEHWRSLASELEAQLQQSQAKLQEAQAQAQLVGRGWLGCRGGRGQLLESF